MKLEFSKAITTILQYIIIHYIILSQKLWPNSVSWLYTLISCQNQSVGEKNRISSGRINTQISIKKKRKTKAFHTHRNSYWILYIFMTNQLNIAIFIIVHLCEIMFEQVYV